MPSPACLLKNHLILGAPGASFRTIHLGECDKIQFSICRLKRFFCFYLFGGVVGDDGWKFLRQCIVLYPDWAEIQNPC